MTEQPALPQLPTLPGAELPKRLLLIGYGYGYIVGCLQDLQKWQAMPGGDGVTLVTPGRPGLESAALRGWAHRRGDVERLADHAAALSEVERVDVAYLAINKREPSVMEVMSALEDAGIPFWGRYVGDYPYPPGSEQAAGTHPAQIARQRADRAEVKRQSDAAREAARRAAQGRNRW